MLAEIFTFLGGAVVGFFVVFLVSFWLGERDG